MSRVFDDNIECTELILRIILDNSDVKVYEVYTQGEIKNLLGHSVRLDIAARDMEDGTQIVYVNDTYRDESGLEN